MCAQEVRRLVWLKHYGLRGSWREVKSKRQAGQSTFRRTVKKRFSRPRKTDRVLNCVFCAGGCGILVLGEMASPTQWT